MGDHYSIMAFLFYVLSSYSVFLGILAVNPSFSRISNSSCYLNSGHTKTWYNIKPIIMDDWKMKVLLSMGNHSLGFYLGFYCSGQSNDDYSLSVVAVGVGNISHIVVWSANRNSPVPENSSLEFSGSGLELRTPDRSRIWRAHREDWKSSLVGMNLTEEGNLVLLGREGNTILWQSFDYPVDTLLVRQRLYKGQMLTNDNSFAGFIEPANFTVFTNSTDGRILMYYQLPTSDYPGHPSGLMYTTDTAMAVHVVNTGASKKSYPLEFIECVKLDLDGHLRRYRYDSRRKNATDVVDLIRLDCELSHMKDRYRLMEVRYKMSFAITAVDIYKTDSLNTTLSRCLELCLQNCSFNAAYFSSEDYVPFGNCSISSDIFLGAKLMNWRNGRAFIKVLLVIGEPSSLPPTPSSSPSPLKALPPALPSRHSKDRLATIISASTAGGLVMIILIILVSLVMFQKNRSENDGEDDLKQVPGVQLRFTLEELEVATEDFKEMLGRGGFGSVFKGVLPDGTRTAVKRLEKMSPGMREFLAEVETIGRLHHFNHVTLVGFCAEKSTRLLVYEYMSNGSLDNWIFSRNTESSYPDWQTRKKFILDVAKGLAYPHEDCRQKIIHLDINPDNILLDENFNAKVSDFGLSKLIERDESQVLIPMRGTPGYLAPEVQQAIVTVKADVYSFGIVILETVSKRRNVDSSRSESSFHLLKLLQKKAEEDQLIDIVEDLDEEMQNSTE